MGLITGILRLLYLGFVQTDLQMKQRFYRGTRISELENIKETMLGGMSYYLPKFIIFIIIIIITVNPKKVVQNIHLF